MSKAPSIIPTVPAMMKSSVLFVIGGLALGLTFRYFGDKPIIKDAKAGWNGDVVGWFK